MLFTSCGPRARFGMSLLCVASCLLCTCLLTPTFGQQATSQQTASQQPAPASKAEKPDIGKAKLMGTGPTETPPVLQQLNSAIEILTARMSPAVVQILVTGYGAVEESDRRQTATAVVTRERAIGSGVIVDSNGYIITNAHVVEGAQSIHVALAMPSVDFPDEVADTVARQPQTGSSGAVGVRDGESGGAGEFCDDGSGQFSGEAGGSYKTAGLHSDRCSHQSWK